MKVLTDASIVDLIIKFTNVHGWGAPQSIAFAREIEAMTFREVFKRSQPEEKR